LACTPQTPSLDGGFACAGTNNTQNTHVENHFKMMLLSINVCQEKNLPQRHFDVNLKL